ncbi:HAD family hydrolase [Mucilaginibacter corticis]|uniref:HAD family hydrolase n=1 Tax=Mucilaginibacter corticis TaxID=2597670 RepID=A0A556MIC5_9SPHI|nr:HAD family hydrolase [Mucilaginibacter corticis]TSJ39671.1 HAD family hydrolase [Mucilaginibacter corticis]
MKRALILDLDNTIYPVSSIAENLFVQFYALLEQDPNIDTSIIEAAKSEMTRRPFQHVADDFNFSPALKIKGIELLKSITYNSPMKPYADYHHIQSSGLDKFLVTTGFTNLQYSKIKQLDIVDDFKEIRIVDPEVSSKTKLDIFKELMDKYRYTPADLLVIGDDPQSEIKAAITLGIDTFLYASDNHHPDAVTTYRGDNLEKVLAIL